MPAQCPWFVSCSEWSEIFNQFNLNPLKLCVLLWMDQTCKNKWCVLYEWALKLIRVIPRQQPIDCVYSKVSHQKDKIQVETSQCLYLLAVTSERPIGFEEGPDPAHRAAPLLTEADRRVWRSRAITRPKEVTLVGQLITTTKHFCQTSGLRDTERFSLLFLLSVKFGSVWVQLCCNRLIGFVSVQLITLKSYLLK